MAIRRIHVRNMQFFFILILWLVYQNTNASKNDDEFVFEELIMNALNGKYYKYCSGWELEVFICKNGQANCCWCNFIHIPIILGAYLKTSLHHRFKHGHPFWT